jgi:uncharacterized protein (DUF927 family)
MSNFDLLDAVLPIEGRYCVIGIGRYPDQRFVDTREKAEELVQEFVQNKIDVYFGCAKFGPENNRTHANATYFKALWMDIDCGPTKGVPDEKGKIAGYLDQTTGLSEFSRFCKAVGLPKPIVINSGNGIHVYWLLDKTISRREWEPLSQRLRELCEENNLIVDSSVFEASRVLRPLNSFNFKDKANPKPVEVISADVTYYAYEQMKELLGAPEPKDDTPDFLPRSVSPMMEALLGNKVKKFETIMIRSAKGEGCNQLLHCYQNQNNIEEPLWFSALSIAAHCVDGNWAGHKMSDQYEGYDAAEVDRKLANIQKKGGPHHCATFKKLNPGGCAGCQHDGKIKSPIVLGIEIAEAVDDGEVEIEDEDGFVETVQIPEYPFPYFRGKNGGVYKKPEDDEDEPVLVYEHDLYVVKRMKHSEMGEVALMRLHLPQDGVKEFSVPATAIVVKEKLREVLAHYGVVPTTKQMTSLSNYLTTFIKNLQFKKKAEIMRTQFGWIDNDSKFILGDREITKDGVFYSPPSETTRGISANIRPSGAMGAWKDVFNMYNKPGLEPHAFAALTGFGSPLLKFTGMKGAIINLIHKDSGTGKSTTLYVCNSIIGHPSELASIWKDTPNSKMFRLGVMNNLANTIDEITNIPALEFSDLIYGISQGRGKDRMKSQSNEMRINNTKWQGITLTSSNASFYEKLGAAKNSPDGENMRLLEYKIEPNTVISVSEGKYMFDHQLMENFGHAGEVFLQYVLNNLEDVTELLRKVQARIDKELQVTAKERFWSATAACNITGGLIAKNLGLHDYDMQAVYKWTLNMLREMRSDVRLPESTGATSSVLGDYINTHMTNTLVVNGAVDARTNLTALPMMEPKGELLIRYEPDTKELFIVAKSFKDYCVKHQINYKDTISALTGSGEFKEAMNKRMSKGMKVLSPAVRVLRFNTDSFDFVPTELSDEDRDSVVSD